MDRAWSLGQILGEDIDEDTRCVRALGDDREHESLPNDGDAKSQKREIVIMEMAAFLNGHARSAVEGQECLEGFFRAKFENIRQPIVSFSSPVVTQYAINW